MKINWLNRFFKKKKTREPKEYEGRFITEEEINEMTKPKSKSFVSSEWDEIESMFGELNSIIKNEDYGRE